MGHIDVMVHNAGIGQRATVMETSFDVERKLMEVNYLAPVALTVAYVVDKSGWIRINPAVYFIDHLPVHVEASDVLVIVLASLAIAVLATVYPSRAAAGLNPVDVIRHE